MTDLKVAVDRENSMFKCLKCGWIQMGVAMSMKNSDDEWVDFCAICMINFLVEHVGQVEVIE